MTIPEITKEHAAIFLAEDGTLLTELVCLFNKRIDAYNKSNAQQDNFITAEEARKLGAGNAEYMEESGEWRVCTTACQYYVKRDFFTFKYRAIKAQPEPVAEQLYCYVSKDGEPAIRMLRTEAQELQRKLGDTVIWHFKGTDVLSRTKLEFDEKTIYTYRTKTTIKLDGRMVTPEQAAAQWEDKKENSVLWAAFDGLDFQVTSMIVFHPNTTQYAQYCIRPKALKQVSWTGSREDVIALLKENGLL